MKRIKYIYIIAVSLLALTSCESYLDLNPHEELAYDQAFKDAAGVEIATRGIYYEMHENDGYYDGLQLILPDVLADNLILCSEGRLTMDLMHSWDISSGNYYVTRAWSQIYVVINRCNQVIARSDAVEAEGDELLLKNHSVGEAYALRAMAHFDLLKYYAKSYTSASDADLGVPYVTAPEPTSPARTPVKECYTNVIADLNTAIELMDAGEIDPAEGNTRFSSLAAKALLARVYLSMENWNDAISLASEVINNSSLASIDEFPLVWTDASEAGVLFKLRMTATDNSQTTSGSTVGVYYSQTGPSGTRSEYVCSYDLYNLFAANDIRLSSWIYTDVYNGKLFNLIWKYKQREGESVPDLVDAKILRVAEMYLIRAEASMNLATPDETTALSDLNTLRAQRYEGFSDGNESGQALINAIDLERRLELAFEGHRWFDLKRKGLPVNRMASGDEADGGGLQYRSLNLPANSYKWQLPIPTVEMDANDNIVQNDQY
ncbi:MAG: RagB/SusD family nutrient uptake outer membrane protein [Bacteroidales bacterium]|nr:RagB/SusD family nutrient uptake outer membrane protein [Bacteroidales bacterium]MBN2818588.1 RagB/SusD family nutrient uptake outer membrane protein [Bacteroidales bacterium]